MIRLILLPLLFLSVSCSKDDNENDSTVNLYGLFQKDIDEAMLIHNNARSDVGVEDLKWSSSLANDAKEWANKMAREEEMYHSENDERPGQGENLYYSSDTDSITPAKNASGAWYQEIELYTYSTTGSDENDFYAIGHYTAMIWKETTEVGMGMAVSKSGKTYVAARYSPPGNMWGAYPY